MLFIHLNNKNHTACHVNIWVKNKTKNWMKSDENKKNVCFLSWFWKDEDKDQIESKEQGSNDVL